MSGGACPTRPRQCKAGAEEEQKAKKEEAISREVAGDEPGKKTEFQTGGFTPFSFRR